MNPQIKADWLTELASGNWRCGTGWLQSLAYAPDSAPTYSPLGVLCEMYRRTGRILYRQSAHSEYASGQYLTAYDGELIALPAVVAEWADMPALPWMKLDWPNGISNLAFINKIGGFDLSITAIENHL